MILRCYICGAGEVIKGEGFLVITVDITTAEAAQKMTQAMKDIPFTFAQGEHDITIVAHEKCLINTPGIKCHCQ
jgi:hypothetical protein